LGFYLQKPAFLKTDPPPKITFTRSAVKNGNPYIKSENSEKPKIKLTWSQ